jgi:hypothetical protein
MQNAMQIHDVNTRAICEQLLGHPLGLMNTLFDNFYMEDMGVILCFLCVIRSTNL